MMRLSDNRRQHRSGTACRTSRPPMPLWNCSAPTTPLLLNSASDPRTDIPLVKQRSCRPPTSQLPSCRLPAPPTSSCYLPAPQLPYAVYQCLNPAPATCPRPKRLHAACLCPQPLMPSARAKVVTHCYSRPTPTHRHSERSAAESKNPRAKRIGREADPWSHPAPARLTTDPPNRLLLPTDSPIPTTSPCPTPFAYGRTCRRIAQQCRNPQSGGCCPPCPLARLAPPGPIPATVVRPCSRRANSPTLIPTTPHTNSQSLHTWRDFASPMRTRGNTTPPLSPHPFTHHASPSAQSPHKLGPQLPAKSTILEFVNF